MINITDKKNCCGCSACANICPKQCISMLADTEGFLYPHIDKSRCIDCNLCETVCNHVSPFENREPIKVLAAMNMDDDIRLSSSSGGLFYSIAVNIINQGGIVFGARFDEDWQVVIDYTDTVEGIKNFMGSKYIQSRIANAYNDAKRFLTEGRQVLFSGTPCQIAGLHKFLRKQYNNLLSIDFICHGTPSPKVWEMYLKNIITANNSIQSISFRNKVNGWKRLHFSIEYNESNKIVSLCSSADQNQYMKAFLSDLILRPSCSSCKAKSCSSQSDITLADFWGIWNVNPEMYDNKGTSMLLINTEKGLKTLPSDGIVKYVNASYEDAKKYNKACIVSISPNPKRTIFFEKLQKTTCVTKLIDNTLSPSFLKKYVIAFKMLIKNLLNSKNWGGNLNASITNPEIISIDFRNKKPGWKCYQLVIKIKGR